MGLDYNNLPKSIISPFTGDVLDLWYTKEEKLKQGDTSLMCFGDKCIDDSETHFNGDYVEAIYVNEKTREGIYI